MITLEAFSRLADGAIQDGNVDVQRVLALIAEAAAGGARFVQIDAQVAQLEQPERVAAHLSSAGLVSEYSAGANGRRVLRVFWEGE